MRVAWRTVGSIIDRVWADTEATVDLFTNIRRIGIDEISYKKGHKYPTVVVCHDTGRLVWVDVGKTKATLHTFFDALEASGQGRCARAAIDVLLDLFPGNPWMRTPAGPTLYLRLSLHRSDASGSCRCGKNPSFCRVLERRRCIRVNSGT